MSSGSDGTRTRALPPAIRLRTPPSSWSSLPFVTPAIRAGSSLIEGFGTGVGGPSGGARIFNRSKVPWITLPSFESAGRSSPAHSR